LKKAALIARVMSLLANPILSIWLMTSSLCEPLNNADGSLKEAPAGWAAPEEAGEGVAGTGAAAADVEVFVDGAGAGGAAGVDVTALAGVDGPCEEAGWALG
jgi:hypothetical protein